MRDWQARAGLALLCSLVAGTIAWACAGPDPSPTWAIDKRDLDPYGSGPMLVPGNDTRANLLLLMADRGVADPSASAGERDGPPLVVMPWRFMRSQALAPASAEDSWNRWSASRCQTLKSGAVAFKAALASSEASPADKTNLAAARDALEPDCQDDEAEFPSIAPTSAVGREFGGYIGAATDFYGGRFDRAARSFSLLARASNPWIAETALYMVARSQLNAAQAANTDRWGRVEDGDKLNAAPALEAGEAFQSYLSRYPDGRYAKSARGLMRRVHWLAGDDPALANDFAAMIPETTDPTGLIDEIDGKWMVDNDDPNASDPLLLAVINLKRMRSLSDWEKEQGETVLTAAELEAQAPNFREHPDLYAYLRAAHAFFVAEQYERALSLIPEANAQTDLTYLDYSRRLLRAFALEKLDRPEAREELLAVHSAANRPYQRAGAELAIAQLDERQGRIDRVFASGSPVTHPVMRALLLEFSAGPDLLRQVATDGGDYERKAALYILLAKQLQRGFYSDFVRDLALLPDDPGEDMAGGWWGAHYYELLYSDNPLSDPPLGVFAANPPADYGCRSLKETANGLASDGDNPRLNLCLAEFFRQRGFDGFQFDRPPANGFFEPTEPTGLGSGPSQFPGKPYVRMDTYMAVLANPRATADDKAFALNRMVRCYAPSGYTSCGDEQVEKDQRKAWFQRLKQQYPNSRWAKDLKYYW